MTPMNLQIEKPPRFMVLLPPLNRHLMPPGAALVCGCHSRLNHLHTAMTMFFTAIATGMTTSMFMGLSLHCPAKTIISPLRRCHSDRSSLATTISLL